MNFWANLCLWRETARSLQRRVLKRATLGHFVTEGRAAQRCLIALVLGPSMDSEGIDAEASKPDFETTPGSTQNARSLNRKREFRERPHSRRG